MAAADLAAPLQEADRASVAADAAPAAAAPASILPDGVAEAPHRFSFHEIMRWLEAKYAGQPRFGHSRRPAQDVIRLGQEPDVTHAPAALARIEPGQEGRRDRLLVHMFGLFGPDGPLPLYLTEMARERQRNHGDAALRRFLDLFHHRLLSLLHRAWADVRPTVSYDRPDEDLFGFWIGALIGFSTPGLRNRDAMPDLLKLHFAGLLSGQTRHAEGLAAILSTFFAAPVRVDSFIGGWLILSDDDRTCLGTSPRTSALGSTVLLGRRVWSRQHRFRVVFGPLTLAEYERLLPGGLSFDRLVPIVRNWAGDALAWDVNLILRRDEVPAIRLGQAGKLGWTTWLMPRSNPNDAADLFLEAGAESHARAVHAASIPEATRGKAA